MHYEYCPRHDDWHIPCNCCGDGWWGHGNILDFEYMSDEYWDEFENCDDPPPCGAYRNRWKYMMAMSDHIERECRRELEDYYYY